MPQMFDTWCVISIYLNTTRSDGTGGTRWWCYDNTCRQCNLSRIVVDSDKIPPLEVESLLRGVDLTRVEAMIQHTRTSQGTRLYKGGVIWHIIKTPPASLTTCNSLWQVWQQLHINRRSNISSVLCKIYTWLSLPDVNSPYSRDLIHCPPPAVSTSCRRCCSSSCRPGRHQAWCCSCCSAPLLPASPPAPACSPADPKPRQKPGNCGIIENLRRIPWEGLSLLIRGTIGAISRSNSKVGGWQLNPGLMGGLSMLNPSTKLFADLAKHRPSWSPAINPI